MLLLFVTFVLVSCSATKKVVTILNYSTPLGAGENVEILGQGQKVPEKAKLIGHIKISDNWTRTVNCTYDVVIKEAQVQARAMGGNLLQITEHLPPGTKSTCHRMKLDVYLRE